jgi:hypothetical protein
MQERRKKLRYDIAVNTRLVVNGKSYDCSVSDIGMGGVLLSVDNDIDKHVSLGESGELCGPVDAMFSGEIVRLEPGLIALKAYVNETNVNYLLDTIFHEHD